MLFSCWASGTGESVGLPFSSSVTFFATGSAAQESGPAGTRILNEEGLCSGVVFQPRLRKKPAQQTGSQGCKGLINGHACLPFSAVMQTAATSARLTRPAPLSPCTAHPQPCSTALLSVVSKQDVRLPMQAKLLPEPDASHP
jgi:hypothetical protein